MERFRIQCTPKCTNIIQQNSFLRVSLLTSKILRIEKGAWTDLPTQTVWNRNLGSVSYKITHCIDSYTIVTSDAEFTVDLQLQQVTSVKLPSGSTVTDFQKGNLLGTARTLDTANGAVRLNPGILSRSGVSVLDDSKSLLLSDDGTILPRTDCSDQYYFAYGHDYKGLLKDFFRITGQVPLIPKFALGNWWSRYKAYTQEEYRTLMQTFLDKELPITVATIDMDWHWTDVLDRFGKDAKPEKPKTKEEVLYNTILPGWTGYTWNTELFPDHKELLNWLHLQNFHITLNVHPSQGIRYYEDQYEAMCQRTGKDPSTRELVPFDITNPDFLTAYFDEIHRPLQEEGVDFWWLDWQQGTVTNIPGLDPLWALNHYHTLDMASTNKRPLILSRYAGLGSHRYPLGFSGDTIVSWKSLAFQPYFTNNAANAGYTWWSHDIGGHMKGVQDDQLYLRWLQYGVFSPINRLHSSNSPFMGKEPWKRSWAVEQAAEAFLRLRHKLIPYLYSANYDTHVNGTPICMPMYYNYNCEEAYKIPNQYIFGGQLMVCPITTPADPKLNLASVRVWLPEGRWTDFFNGRIYQGGGWVTMYRDLDSIPVLAPQGAIVPMYQQDRMNDLSLEQPLEIHIWRGNGSYELYEDDGETMEFEKGFYAITKFHQDESEDSISFTIQPPAESHGLLPENRTMILRFRDIQEAKCSVNGKDVVWSNAIPIQVAQENIVIELTQIRIATNPPKDALSINMMTRVQGGNDWKSTMFQPKKMPKFLKDALEEFDHLIDL